MSSPTLISIAIQHPATKLSYTVGDASPPDITGLVVTGTYSNATTRIVTPDSVTGFDSSNPVNNEVITIHVGTQTTFYTIDVVAQVMQINLGTADTFGILANTYANTATGVGIIGYVGYAIPPTLVPTISGSTYVSQNPMYLQAGTDQDITLNALNVLLCDHTFGTATDLSLLPQPLTPGVYCITGAQSVGMSGITLDGVGTFVFRSTGTLDTNANSHVTLLGGANASNIFWVPVATTLGANSVFVGTDIDNSGITISDNVRWLGRALDFASTVTTGTGVQITVPAVDVTNPVTTITSPTDNTFSNSVSMNLSGISSDVNLDVTTISVDGGPFVATSGTASLWTFFATGLSEGLHTFQTRATDAGGNAGLSSIVHVTINAVVTRANSTSIVSATGVGQINSITSSGNFTSFASVSESSLHTTGKPTTEQFPFGFFSFHIVGLTPGQAIHVTQTYPSILPAGTNYWKVDNGMWINETSLISINGNTLTLTMTDGGPEDSDHAVNGEITDPGGPGIPSAPISVLTSSSSDVTIYHPPSLGNDYYHPYSNGLKISSVDENGLEFNGRTFDITKYGSTVPQQVLEIGQSANFTFKIYDERGSNTISHIGMYMHFKGDVIVTNSDMSIVW
ncbi:MAG TPA: choice-of-anchor U domain-containing protein, partial [Candidatus Nitrosotalea sp.]|nr:choice-of-anchor U domain-containing protein [Candidatus Nitrosotalea sp.]